MQLTFLHKLETFLCQLLALNSVRYREERRDSGSDSEHATAHLGSSARAQRAKEIEGARGELQLTARGDAMGATIGSISTALATASSVSIAVAAGAAGAADSES